MRAGLVGCGFIGMKHLKSLANCEQLTLTAVCDVHEQAAQAAVHDYQAIRGGEEKVSIYLDYEEMLRNGDCDIVVICVLSGLHISMAKQALQYNKHLVIEKPVGLSIHEAREIEQIAIDQSKTVIVCHQKRYFPHLQYVREIVQSGAIGDVVLGSALVQYNRNDAYYAQAKWRGTWQMDGGVLLNQAIHDIDLLLWMTGHVSKITGMMETKHRSIDAEETAAAVYQLEHGGLLQVAATVCADSASSYEQIRITGTKGSIELSGKWLENVDVWHVEGKEPPTIQSIDPYLEMYHDLVDAIREQRPPIADITGGIQALEAVLGIYASVKQDSAVELPLSQFSTSEMSEI